MRTWAAAIGRRKAIYEQLHPETMAGAAQAAAMNAAQGRGRRSGAHVATFTKATADATGRSERSIQKAATRGKKMGAPSLIQ